MSGAVRKCWEISVENLLLEESTGCHFLGSGNLCSLLTINSPLIFPSIFLLLPTFIIGQVVISNAVKSGAFNQSPRLWKAVYVAGMLFMLFAFAPSNSPRFFYYQF